MKRIISIVLLALIAFSIVFSLAGCRRRGGLDDSSASRSIEAINNEAFHYFDSEAIALADSSGDTASLRSEALRAYNMVNDERERAGLNPLVWDSNLESTSDVRARECEQSFSHTRPDGNPWYTVNSEIMAGENLAYGYETAGDVLRGWMESPTHRENILYPTFTKISISVYVADDGCFYWAQEFGY